MVLAQLPNTTPGGMGDWLIQFAAILAILVMLLTGANQIKQLLARKRRPKRAFSDRFVTKAELKNAVETLAEQMKRNESTLAAALNKHEDYTHRRLHDLGNAVGNLSLKVAEMTAAMQTMIASNMKPICEKVDRLVVTTAAIAVRLELPVQLDGIRALPPNQEA